MIKELFNAIFNKSNITAAKIGYAKSMVKQAAERMDSENLQESLTRVFLTDYKADWTEARKEDYEKTVIDLEYHLMTLKNNGYNLKEVLDMLCVTL